MLHKLTFQKFVFTCLIMFGLIVSGQAQEHSNEVDELYNHTEQIYSTDDLLVNGQIYIPTRRGAMGSPYFGENQFSNGIVIIKGRQFDDVLLKFNLEDQRLILRAALESGKYVTIVLNPKMLDAFSIGGHEFINANHYFNSSDFSGFYTLVYEGNFAFLIKYEKEFRPIYDTQTPNGSYNEMSLEYFVLEEGKLENITKKKALLSYFSIQKKEIKSFMREYKIQYKKASIFSLNKLMRYCDSVSRNK